MHRIIPSQQSLRACAAPAVIAALWLAANPATLSAAAGGGGTMETVFKLVNFAILVGTLVYFLRAPIAAYLASRSAQIRQDLVTAAEMRSAASAQLAEIEKKMQALPGELEALRRQGAEDVKAEQARMAQAAADERARLLEQTKRELDMRLRIARRELTELAAQLAVGVAEERIRRSITPDDQVRLIDRYASQLREAR
ncbi:MAG TPA: ATP synthase F0 subunit B [Vicinamibacterales bacterium]|nr:ATP synthase F0 subunit B [Vicinamibacterales bacterium]